MVNRMFKYSIFKIFYDLETEVLTWWLTSGVLEVVLRHKLEKIPEALT